MIDGSAIEDWDLVNLKLDNVLCHHLMESHFYFTLLIISNENINNFAKKPNKVLSLVGFFRSDDVFKKRGVTSKY